MVNGETQRLIALLKQLRPEGCSGLRQFGVKTLPLPNREVRIPNRQRIKIGLAGFAKGAVGLGQFAAEDSHRGAVEGHLVHRYNEPKRMRSATIHRGAEQKVFFEVEGSTQKRLCAAKQFRVPGGASEARSIHDVQFEPSVTD